MNTIGDDWGPQVSIGKKYIAEVHQGWNQYATVQINIGYENANVTYTLSFDDEYRLIGLYMK